LLLAVLFGVLLGGVLVVFHGMQSVAVRDLGVMRGLLVVAGLVMLGRFAVMLGRVLVVIRRVLMVLMDSVLAHLLSSRFQFAFLGHHHLDD
jgi:hypothetical protein